MSDEHEPAQPQRSGITAEWFDKQECDAVCPMPIFYKGSTQYGVCQKDKGHPGQHMTSRAYGEIGWDSPASVAASGNGCGCEGYDAAGNPVCTAKPFKVAASGTAAVATSEPQEFRVLGAEVFDAKGISLYRFGTRHDAHDVCKVINAALAAERDEVRIMTNHCVQLRQELATERERCKATVEHVGELLKFMRDSRKQLVDLLEEVLAHTVNTPAYPDGPCLDKDLRDDIKAALAQAKEQL